MSNGLRLIKHAFFETESGEILVVDPSHLEGFDVSAVTRAFDSDFDRGLELRSQQIGLSTRIADLKISSAEILLYEIEQGMATTDLTGKTIKEFEEELRGVEQKINRLEADPNTSPPYLVQGEGFVCFQNTIGGGHYPVVRYEGGIKIVFNYPLREGWEDPVLDEKRLPGKLLGRSFTHGGMLLLIDPKHVKLCSDVEKYLVCVIQWEKGRYLCHYADKNDSLVVSKPITLRSRD